MNIRHQIPSRQTETASYSERRTEVGAVRLRRLFNPFDMSRIVPKSMLCLGLTVLVWGTSPLGHALQQVDVSSSDDPPVLHVVTGTLDQLDFNSGKGLLKTDLGKPIFFQIVRPEIFRRLSVGQRVTIGVNEQGHAIKVMEIPPVELPSPPTTGK
jgi:cold shock CspA family protein